MKCSCFQDFFDIIILTAMTHPATSQQLLPTQAIPQPTRTPNQIKRASRYQKVGYCAHCPKGDDIAAVPCRTPAMHKGKKICKTKNE